MAEVIKLVPKAHPCDDELKRAFPQAREEFGTGTTVKCSCGRKFRWEHEQRDGYFWMPIYE